MSLFQDTIKDIGENIASYSKSAWNNFLRQAQSEINGLAEYYLIGYKDVSMLKSNLTYIKSSISAVNGADGTEDRADFTYYNDGTASTSGNAQTLLARPKEDKREGINDSFKTPSTLKSREKGKNYHYTEKGGSSRAYNSGNWEEDGYFDYTYDSTDLVSRTVQWMQGVNYDQKRKFISERFNNTISRFHTKNDTDSLNELKNGVDSTAYSTKYGLSHGRNLLKTNPDSSQEYDNPYCRVWTWHHQYGQYAKDTIRPFVDANTNVTLNNGDFEKDYKWGYFRNGGSRLDKYGSMFDDKGRTTGLVNITPVGDGRGSFDISTKKCMFSIENLAWKGHTQHLSWEQIGPSGGRIMWFPPYDLKFNEETSASWEKNVFIGRGEPMYTYSNTERSGTLSFKLLIDHPAILDYWERRGDADDASDSDETKGKDQELLRFFAGCSMLTAANPYTNEQPSNGGNKKEQDPATDPNSKVIQFFVYYPNNYSGMDDKVGGEISAMDYLAHGIGTQKKYNYDTDKIEDFNVPITQEIYYKANKVTGGYEMGDNGVSLVTNLTSSNSICNVIIDNTRTTLMKEFDKHANKAISGTTDPNDSWHHYRYYYRADKNTLDQKLIFAESYIDKSSSKLNSTGYKNSTYYQHTIKDTGCTYSFAEVYAAVEENYGYLDESLYDKTKVAEIKAILRGEKGKITKITSKGRASSQANNKSDSVNTKRNNTLSKNRAKSVNNWLKNKLNLTINPEVEKWSTDKETDYKDQESSVAGAKQGRFAFVTIYYTPTDSEDGNETTGADSGTSVVHNDKLGTYENESGATNSNSGDTTSTSGNTITTSSVKVTKNNNTTVQDKYGGEDVFFKKLEREDPFIFKKISDKIMYFDPVFHSMSPEGFNSRLTFLQQCMRQGPTMGNSETNSKNANNLAFGMAPVCVLRIGDFYNTRVIINSISINYDPMTWDLNHEGIGVMPMIADVSLNFNFIGGSELGGPISRLQNALSFNYYANTSVHDSRAETIDDGVLTPWTGNSTVLHTEKT